VILSIVARTSFFRAYEWASWVLVIPRVGLSGFEALQLHHACTTHQTLFDAAAGLSCVQKQRTCCTCSKGPNGGVVGGAGSGVRVLTELPGTFMSSGCC